MQRWLGPHFVTMQGATKQATGWQGASPTGARCVGGGAATLRCGLGRAALQGEAVGCARLC